MCVSVCCCEIGCGCDSLCVCKCVCTDGGVVAGIWESQRRRRSVGVWGCGVLGVGCGVWCVVCGVWGGVCWVLGVCGVGCVWGVID